ncbi:uncharacterized protein BO66DRAFT_396363 [Aspergillus aculeatinus CBS 121060]|uniref:Uncharacterized protein n=1 Tax=Aspergillus aculeatinus CBS 121060 TaxID=1448322 RepID=A0ACD1GSW3_9EURO|nr:hypothetical protein BO66DRAFT_396363 [Aspergillus aculeatinus CBS 121060]RAH64227.1 hypothetical protein BO66DRAFT_396363 [Aspergillus aculeatinus CBS 121060]
MSWPSRPVRCPIVTKPGAAFLVSFAINATSRITVPQEGSATLQGQLMGQTHFWEY